MLTSWSGVCSHGGIFFSFFAVAYLRSTAWLGKEEKRGEKISFSVFTSGSPLQAAGDVGRRSGPAGDVTGGVK